MTLPDLIKQARNESGLTQQQLADLIGTGKAYVSGIENGSFSLSEGKADEILAAMGYTLEVSYKIEKK